MNDPNWLKLLSSLKPTRKHDSLSRVIVIGKGHQSITNHLGNAELPLFVNTSLNSVRMLPESKLFPLEMKPPFPNADGEQAKLDRRAAFVVTKGD